MRTSVLYAAVAVAADSCTCPSRISNGNVINYNPYRNMKKTVFGLVSRRAGSADAAWRGHVWPCELVLTRSTCLRLSDGQRSLRAPWERRELQAATGRPPARAECVQGCRFKDQHHTAGWSQEAKACTPTLLDHPARCGSGRLALPKPGYPVHEVDYTADLAVRSCAALIAATASERS